MIKYEKYNNVRMIDMARPRVFISSTFFDLKQIRFDLDRFIKDLGYDTVRNELGDIPYSKEFTLEDACYKEVENVDIMISIVGGRFGTTSIGDSQYSISQNEIRAALKKDKQVFIFIDKNVHSEYYTYLANKNVNPEHLAAMKFNFADNIKIYQHIEFLESLKKNNVIQSFESSSDITVYLKEQFAGLFQRFLQNQKKSKEFEYIEQLSNTANTLQQMVTYLSKANENHSEAVSELVLSNHPAMNAIREALNTKMRVFFLSKDELVHLLNTFGFSQNIMMKDDGTPDEYWTRMLKKTIINIEINDILFDSHGKLKPMRQEEWSDEYIKRWISNIPDQFAPPDDVPF